MSKVRQGIAEFESVLGKNKESNMKSSPLSDSLKPVGSQSRKRNALGRGLSALMSSTAVSVEPTAGNTALAAFSEPEPAEARAEAEKPQALTQVPSVDTPLTDGLTDGQLVYLPIEQLHPNPNQPRQRFSQQEIDELADSLTRTGLLQPILVRKTAGNHGSAESFEIVAGERRFRAAQQAGLAKLPVTLRELDDRQVLEISIIENVQRSQLDALEEAEAYQRLKDEFGLSQEEIAETVGKDRTTVANALRLLKLGTEARSALIDGQLSAGHARTLLGLSNERLQGIAVKQVLKNGLSVRATEDLVRKLSAPQKGASEPRSRKANREEPRVQQLEERIRRVLGTKVQLTIEQSGEGRLVVDFFSEEELERLLDQLGA